ncbi:MAG: hypothetical protein OXI16_13820 [Chloroflexota bacterium]|nr:hypothetical protein [Chloroflexota bacterium]
MVTTEIMTAETISEETTAAEITTGETSENPTASYANGFANDATNVFGDMDMSMDRPSIKAVFSIELRMSSIRQCMRRLAYEAFGFAQSDAEPLRNRIMMAQGHLLENFVKQAMREDGWTINEEEGVVMRHGPVVLTGHPDGVAMHPEKAGGMPAVLEVKTRSKGMAEYAWTYGVDVSNPEAVEQAALYSMALFGEITDVVVATMERTSDQYEWRPQRVPAIRVGKAYGAALERINEITAMIIKGEVPEPEYPQGDANCKSCPFRSMCGNADEPELVAEGGLSDEELFEQVRIWAGASSRIPKTPSNPATKEKSAAAAAIKAHYIETSRAGDELEVDGQRYKLTLSTKPGTTIDFDAFNELVDPDIREQILLPTESHTMRITPVKDKSQKGRAKKGKGTVEDAAARDMQVTDAKAA